MLYKSLNAYEFVDYFLNWEQRASHFSYDALHALFDHLDQSDEPVELDVVGLCCEFTEYANPEEYMEGYGLTIYDTDLASVMFEDTHEEPLSSVTWDDLDIPATVIPFGDTGAALVSEH